MDFIPDLPPSQGFDAILTTVDRFYQDNTFFALHKEHK
jgi:hypothetical protein